jgi:hypothetical protein
MRLALFISFIFFSVTAPAQRSLKIFTEKENDVTVFYAVNNEYCPVSVELTLTLDKPGKQRVFKWRVCGAGICAAVQAV